VYLLAALLHATPVVSLLAAKAEDELITLDPVCKNIELQLAPLAPGNPAPGTRRMAQRLKEIFDNVDPRSIGFFNDRLVVLLEGQLTNTSLPVERIPLQFQLGMQQMNSARPDQALNTFNSVERALGAVPENLIPNSQTDLRWWRAVAYLRLGEQENCLATHNAESCIFPLGVRAQHRLPRGSRGAIAQLRMQLEQHPNDLGARWLLNLAHMTLGEYPDKVDPRHLIPPGKFASEYNLPRFPDVSEGLGVDLNDLAGGVIIDDFDNDGRYDLVLSAWDHRGQLRYFRNKGNGTFTQRTSEAGLVGEVGALNIQQTDYNNDGWLDIWALRGAWQGKTGRLPNSLLRNNGDGTFTDVTEEAGLLSFHPTQASRWFDYDGDGWLDLFVGNETVDPADPDWCELYHNNRDGTFTECSESVGLRIADFVKGVACGDYDNDGRPDLYISVRGGKGILIRNEGPVDRPPPLLPGWRFSDTTAQAGLSVGEPATFGSFFFDYDNDGWEDLAVFGYLLKNGVADVAADYLGLPTDAARFRLFRNNRNGTFVDVSAQTHMNRVVHTMGHNYGDLDNDGWLDFYCGTGDPDFSTLIPNRMFRNAEGRLFQDVTTATGTGHIQKGHGVAFADLDDDGDHDVYSVLGGAFSGDLARNALFLNPGNTNRWLKLQLVGTKANRAAIGARVRIDVRTPTGPRHVFRVISSGGSFGSNPLRLEIGLGNATAIDGVEIQWPGSNTRQRVTSLQLDRAYRIQEGSLAPVALKLHPVNLDHAPPARRIESNAGG